VASETRSPPRFFLLLFALSVPFWLAGGTTAWQPLPGVPISALMFVCPSLAAAVLVSAIDEQLGWSGYALDPLQTRCHALCASLILGVVWAAWHIIPLQQAGRAGDWIAWWCLVTISLRVLQTWLYNNTGRSVFAAAVFQASANASWQLFPNRGSHYDPQVTGLILAGLAALVAGVWGPRTLTWKASW
jgi:uncharacterized protein